MNSNPTDHAHITLGSDHGTQHDEANAKKIDRQIAMGGTAGVALGVAVTFAPFIAFLDELRAWIAGTGGFLDGFGIPLVVVSLLLPFLDDEWAVRQVEKGGKVKKITTDLVAETKSVVIGRPWVAALAAGYVLMVQLIPVIATALEEDFSSSSKVTWAPAAGFLISMVILFVMQGYKGSESRPADEQS